MHMFSMFLAPVNLVVSGWTFGHLLDGQIDPFCILCLPNAVVLPLVKNDQSSEMNL